MNKSVTRRVLAIVFSACGAGVLTALSLVGNEVALAALIATVGTVTGFYFGAKGNSL